MAKIKLPRLAPVAKGAEASLDLGDVVGAADEIGVLFAAIKAVTVDNDGDGKKIEFEQGEFKAIMDAVFALIVAVHTSK